MFARLLILLLVVPLAELALLLYVHFHLAERLGAGYALLATAGLVLGTAVAGAALARQQGFRVLRSLQTQLQKGHMPGPEALDAVLVLLGAVLLLTPGIITDLVGFALLIPWTRRPIRGAVLYRLARRVSEGTIRFRTTMHQSHGTRGPSGGQTTGEILDTTGRVRPSEPAGPVVRADRTDRSAATAVPEGPSDGSSVDRSGASDIP